MYDSKKRYVLLPALATIMLVPRPSSAIDLISTNISNASGNCHVTDFSYSQQAKYKALALDNVGTSGIFVNCGLLSDESAAGITSLSISVHNQNSVPATVTCTAVIGTSASPATYYSKSVGIGPGAENQITWTAAGDGGGILFEHPAAITCALPGNTGVTTDEVSYAIQLL